MMLKDKYFKVNDCTKGEGLSADYSISLLEDCEVYAGHFPGEPICPGVCNIQTVKECMMLLTGEKSLSIRKVKRCRFKALMSPQTVRQLNVHIDAAKHDDGYTVVARIYNAETDFMEFNGEMSS